MNTHDADGMAWSWQRGLAGLLGAAGLALVGWGTYLHLQLAGRLGAGACDACSPWHPLFVVAPLVVGTALVVGAAIAWRKTRID